MSNTNFQTVPCNGCTRCCVMDMVRILPHEDASKWETVEHPYNPKMRMLAHKPNGECFYLGEGGCTIQDDKPQICGEMDCRNITQAMTFDQAKMFGIVRIWRKGQELIASDKGEV